MIDTAKKLITLEQDVFSVRIFDRFASFGYVQFFQSQCERDKKRCRILYQLFDFNDPPLDTEFEVVANIAKEDCLLKDFYVVRSNYYKSIPEEIMYICIKKNYS